MSKLYLGSSLIQTTAMGTTAGNLEMWSPPPMGTMSIEGQFIKKNYTFEIGMTWEQWISSKYNTDGFYIHKERVTPDGSQIISYSDYGDFVNISDTVQDGTTYVNHKRIVL